MSLPKVKIVAKLSCNSTSLALLRTLPSPSFSTLAPQKGGKSGFKKSFKSGYDDIKKLNWRFGPIYKDKLKCNYCGKMRHTNGNCWDLM